MVRSMLLLLPLTAGCLKHGPAHVAAQPVPLTVITAMGSFREAGVAPLPQGAVERVAAELEVRNLVLAGGGEHPALFEQRRSLAARIDALTAAGVAGPVLLVTCDPRFDTQVNGRFKWDVHCDVAVFPVDAEDGRLTGNIDASAHLVYYHQQEAAAVDEVAAVLAREVGRVLDTWRP